MLRARLAGLFAPGPSEGAFPGFLTPGSCVSVDEGCDAIRETSRERLTADLRITFAGRPVPPWIRRLAGGDPGPLHEVADAVEHVHETFVAPCGPRIRDLVAADRAARLDTLGRHGLGETPRLTVSGCSRTCMARIGAMRGTWVLSTRPPFRGCAPKGRGCSGSRV